MLSKFAPFIWAVQMTYHCHITGLAGVMELNMKTQEKSVKHGKIKAVKALGTHMQL